MKLPVARLGEPDVVDIILGQSPASSSYNTAGEGDPFYQGKADFGWIHPSTRVWCTAGGSFAEANDVLLSVRAPVGDVNIADQRCAIGRGVTALRARARCDATYLFFAMQFVRPELEQRATGSTFASVNKASLLALEIPLPDPSDQSLIGRTLMFVANRVDQEASLEVCASALKRAVMRELFTQGLRGEDQKETALGPVPDSWTVTPLEDRFSVVSGGTPPRGVRDYWVGGTIPWVKTGEIDYSTITETEERITRAGLENSAARILPKGTVLMAMYGQGVTRARVGVLGIDAACNQACAALLPRDGAVLPLFVYYLLTHRYEDIRRLAHGGQQQNLNMDIVKALPLSYPADPDEQREIVEILDAIDQKIDLHKRKKAILEELFKALLHKLMTGEIRVADFDLSALDIAAPMEARA